MYLLNRIGIIIFLLLTYSTTHAISLNDESQSFEDFNFNDNIIDLPKIRKLEPFKKNKDKVKKKSKKKEYPVKQEKNKVIKSKDNNTKILKLQKKIISKPKLVSENKEILIPCFTPIKNKHAIKVKLQE